MNNKILTLLGFASKARKLSYGMLSVKEALKSGKSCLVISCCDISEKSKKETAFFAEKSNTRFKVLTGFDIKTVSDAVGRQCGIISINDSGFADALLRAYTEGGNANDK